MPLTLDGGMMSVNTGALHAMMIEKMIASDGFLSFDDFMSMALYESKLGYYEREHVFGAQGDYVTGVDLGPWLALGFADLIVWGWEQLGCPKDWVLLEQGGGSGRLLTQVLRCLREKGIEVPKIVAVERSAWMRERQKVHYKEHGFDVEQYEILTDLSFADPVLMMCNELPDAFPVQCFTYSNHSFFERGVGFENDEWVWKTSAEPMLQTPNIAESIQQALPDDYQSEFNPNLAEWQQNIADVMSSGFVFCVDYGYSQQEYYRPNREQGTLMGHRAHQVIDDVLKEPGSCDITAHIDFTDLALSGLRYNLLPTAFMAQGAWLAQSPTVQAAIVALAEQGSVEAMQALAHAKRMLLPFGMGETFKILIQCKGVQKSPDYLKTFDRLSDLRLDV